MRAIPAAAERQGLEMRWTNASVHFKAILYEQANDLLLSMLCP